MIMAVSEMRKGQGLPYGFALLPNKEQPTYEMILTASRNKVAPDDTKPTIIVTDRSVICCNRKNYYQCNWFSVPRDCTHWLPISLSCSNMESDQRQGSSKFLLSECQVPGDSVQNVCLVICSC